MSSKATAWTLLAAIAFATVVLFNYWAAFQPVSTLAYLGIVVALCGLANLILPFRCLGISKRATGALLLVGGWALTLIALSWPASSVRVGQPATLLDEIMPEYQFYEKHSTRIHARPEQVIQAVRDSTFGDWEAFVTLMRIRGWVSRRPFHETGDLHDKRVLDAFSESGYLSGGSEHEIAMFGLWDARANRQPDVRTLQDFADCRNPGTVKMAYNFNVEDAGGGWSTITAETRVLALDDATRRGMARYWRLIVPGSGLIRREWLDAIKRRAESMPKPRS